MQTYATIVMGAMHLLEAVNHTPGVKAVVDNTSDWYCENRERVWCCREGEPLGGFDPYINCKGYSEMIASANPRYFMQVAGVAMASTSAGDIIGGELDGAHPCEGAARRSAPKPPTRFSSDTYRVRKVLDVAGYTILDKAVRKTMRWARSTTIAP